MWPLENQPKVPVPSPVYGDWKPNPLIKCVLCRVALLIIGINFITIKRPEAPRDSFCISDKHRVLIRFSEHLQKSERSLHHICLQWDVICVSTSCCLWGSSSHGREGSEVECVYYTAFVLLSSVKACCLLGLLPLIFIPLFIFVKCYKGHITKEWELESTEKNNPVQEKEDWNRDRFVLYGLIWCAL